MAIKQAETAAAVAALQIRSKAHVEHVKHAAARSPRRVSRRTAWRGGGASLNPTAEASRKDKIREALQQTEDAAKKSLQRSLKAHAKKTAQKARLAAQRQQQQREAILQSTSGRGWRGLGGGGDPAAKTAAYISKKRRKKKKKSTKKETKAESSNRKRVEATDAAADTMGEPRRFTFVQNVDIRQGARQSAAAETREDQEEVMGRGQESMHILIEEDEDDGEDEDDDGVIDIVLDDDADEEHEGFVDRGPEPELVLMSVEEQLALIEEEAKQIQQTSQNNIADDVDADAVGKSGYI
jgi:hypothetical protein